jgi:hypothetical protein
MFAVVFVVDVVVVVVVQAVCNVALEIILIMKI